ncbi:MAG TPA: anthranilate phosphoribosyltransferase [Candidatus Brocadiia bacterium]|nr:anthranilate phosphoribosyltransferase [Candidatus Brocadiia bacterium]
MQAGGGRAGGAGDLEFRGAMIARPTRYGGRGAMTDQEKEQEKLKEEAQARLKQALGDLLMRRDLGEDRARDAMTSIMSGLATPAQIAGFLVALRMKGETIAEITGCARAMRAASERVRLDDPCAIDTCGTGGTGKNTINVSTAAGFIAAGAGVKVAKHGNRAASGSTGSADVLAALGARIDLPPPAVERCIRETNFGFMFAPVFHKAMKHAIGPRRELGARTVFNILGPLTNPAGVRRQVMGVPDPALLDVIAEALRNLGSVRLMIVHSMDGMDEISTSAPTQVCELIDGQLLRREIDPAGLGLAPVPREAIRATGPAESAAAVRAVLSGKDHPGAGLVLVNAAAAIVVSGRAKDLAEGLEAARESVASGRAAASLERFTALSNEPVAEEA